MLIGPRSEGCFKQPRASAHWVPLVRCRGCQSPNRRSSEPAGAPSSPQATYPQGSDTRHTAFDLPPYRTSKTMEIIMAVVRCDDYSPYGMTCPQCNDLMIAPSRSAYVSSNSALHCWSCDTCGHDAEIFDRFVRLSCVETAFWRFQT